mgnify:CR=1 FL=1
MGRRADLPASELDDREGVYIKPQSAVVTTKTARKNKKALLNMAGIVIATRQAVSLNCFSASRKQGNAGAAPDFSAAESLNMSRINF